MALAFSAGERGGRDPRARRGTPPGDRAPPPPPHALSASASRRPCFRSPSCWAARSWASSWRSCSLSTRALCFCVRCSSSSASSAFAWPFSCVMYRWACGGRKDGCGGPAGPACGWAPPPGPHPPPAAPHLQLDLLQLGAQRLHLSLQGLDLQVPGDRGQAGLSEARTVLHLCSARQEERTQRRNRRAHRRPPGVPRSCPPPDHSPAKAVPSPLRGWHPGPSPVVPHGAVGGSKRLFKEVGHHLPQRSMMTPAPAQGGEGGREGGPASPGPRQGEGPLTAGSPAGGPVPISMRFSGSSSSVVSSGITTTGLMCSARAEARRKLGGPCGGQTGSCSAVPQESSLCHPQSAPGALAGSRGRWRAWGPGRGRGGVPAGTSGSRGIWMSRLK